MNPAGNVGIGTTSPGAKLDVIGDIKANLDESFDNWFRNPSFEAWETSTQPAYTSNTGISSAQETTNVHSGTYAVKLTDNGASTGWFHMQLKHSTDSLLFAGKKLVASAWVKTSEANLWRLQMRINDASGNAVAWLYSDYHSGSGEWEQLVIRATLPSNAANIGTLRLTESDGTLAYIDDVYVGLGDIVWEYPSSFDAEHTENLTHWADLYVMNGNVGIGTTSPSSLLQIYANDDVTTGTQKISQNSTGDASIKFEIVGTQAWAVGIDNSDDDKFKISYASDLNTNNAVTIDTSGNVGIGTTDPQATLDVEGDFTIKNELNMSYNG
ncbi:MAG: hypothetical protein ACTSPB_26905, partial [Candidatus Thorarchaeota archaeon]